MHVCEIWLVNFSHTILSDIPFGEGKKDNALNEEQLNW
jgi:hypothetical protein